MSIMASATAASCTICTLVSRRAAGVWTQLPSLTYALLDLLPPPCTVVWADFGLRYEMFNHLRIAAHGFPRHSTLLQLMAHKSAGRAVSASDLTTYAQTVCGNALPPFAKALSEIRGEKIQEYRHIVARRTTSGEQIYMLPWYAPLVPAKLLTHAVDVGLLEAVMLDLLERLKPRFLFLTWEGQPEARLFQARLREDALLRWGLAESHLLISLVRFDSEERFRDSVSVPTLLAEDRTLRHKLRLVLTRVARQPRPEAAAIGHVIGQLPFAAFVGEAVNAGRIPFVDMWDRKNTNDITAVEMEYLNSMTALARKLVECTRGN
jgi:hypothetical protein